jgi:hypothetical protein
MFEGKPVHNEAFPAALQTIPKIFMKQPKWTAQWWQK